MIKKSVKNILKSENLKGILTIQVRVVFSATTEILERPAENLLMSAGLRVNRLEMLRLRHFMEIL